MEKEITVDEAFQQWLDEPMLSGMYAETRGTFAKKTGTRVADLKWAFIMGYCRGKDSMKGVVNEDKINSL